tara:strand:- start:285 stop:773 length:489 start_codon:yes stop_codon:yes gene_type:complete
MDDSGPRHLKIENTSRFGDIAAICLSNVCIIHCLALPVLTVMIPSSLSTVLEEEVFHLYMLILVLPISIWALLMGCRKHKQLRVSLLGSFGLLGLVLVTFYGHDLFGEIGEKLLTVIGAALIACAHFFNFKACRGLDSECDLCEEIEQIPKNNLNPSAPQSE